MATSIETKSTGSSPKNKHSFIEWMSSFLKIGHYNGVSSSGEQKEDNTLGTVSLLSTTKSFSNGNTVKIYDNSRCNSLSLNEYLDITLEFYNSLGNLLRTASISKTYSFSNSQGWRVWETCINVNLFDNIIVISSGFQYMSTSQYRNIYLAYFYDSSGISRGEHEFPKSYSYSPGILSGGWSYNVDEIDIYTKNNKLILHGASQFMSDGYYGFIANTYLFSASGDLLNSNELKSVSTYNDISYTITSYLPAGSSFYNNYFVIYDSFSSYSFSNRYDVSVASYAFDINSNHLIPNKDIHQNYYFSHSGNPYKNYLVRPSVIQENEGMFVKSAIYNSEERVDTKILILSTATTPSPTKSPTFRPTYFPSVKPSSVPTKIPTRSPTVLPSENPSCSPSGSPTSEPILENQEPSYSPSYNNTYNDPFEIYLSNYTSTNISHYENLDKNNILEELTLYGNNYKPVVFYGEGQGDLTGFSIANAGNICGEGENLIIGAPGYNNDQGIVYFIVANNKIINSNAIDLSTITKVGIGIKITTSEMDGEFGWKVDGNYDFDEDGIKDIVISSPKVNHDGKILIGSVYVVSGKQIIESFNAGKDINVNHPSNKVLRINGQKTGDLFGWSVAFVKKNVKNSHADLVVGAPFQKIAAGKAYYIPSNYINGTLALNNQNDNFISIYGANSRDESGTDVTSLFSIRNDNKTTFAVSSHLEDPSDKSDAGCINIITKNGQLPNVIDLKTNQESWGAKLCSNNLNDEFSYRVASGDINNDKIPELIVSARNAEVIFDGSIEYRAGLIYVFIGGENKFPPNNNIDIDNLPPQDGYKIFGAKGGDHCGEFINIANDIDEDGINDLIIACSYHDINGASDVGALYFITGNSDLYLKNFRREDGVVFYGASKDDKLSAGLTLNFGSFGNSIALTVPHADIIRSEQVNSDSGYVVMFIPEIPPTSQPTSQPSADPTSAPSGIPTGDPTGSPTGTPTDSPTADPSASPSGQPSADPTSAPSGIPTGDPTGSPTGTPTDSPTADPSTSPSGHPSAQPTGQPSSYPTGNPTAIPTSSPTTCKTFVDENSCVLAKMIRVYSQSNSNAWFKTFACYNSDIEGKGEFSSGENGKCKLTCTFPDGSVEISQVSREITLEIAGQVGIQNCTTIE